MAEVPPVESLLEHAAFARRLARALVGDAARADDVVQTSWLAALQHPPKAGRGLKAWFAKVVRHAAWRLHREESRRGRRERQAAAPERLPSTLDVAAQLSAERALLDAVARLDEPYRATIHARFFEERTPTQIAAAMGVPVRTVETRLRRAIARLRAELDERFEGGSAAWAGLLLGGTAVATGSKSFGVAVAVVVAIAAVATPWIVISAKERRASEGGAPVVRSADAKAPSPAEKADAATAATTETARAVAPSAARESARCTVAVVTPEGAPIAGADLVLFRGEEVLADAATGANGEATLPKEDAACRLLVAAGCAPVRVVDVPAASESVEVALEGGAVCSGRVTVEGKAPDGPLELEFDGAARRDEAPDAVWKRLQQRGTKNASWVRATTGREGDFVVFGLVAHQKLTILVPAPYEVAATTETWVRLDEAREGLEIALRFNPTIRGRVLDRQGEPLARWKVEGWLVSPSSSGNEPLATTGDDGRFRIVLHNHRGDRGDTITSGVLYVSDPTELFVCRVAIDHPIGEGGDVGDIVVDTARVLMVEARDPDGRALDDFALVVERQIHDGDITGHPWMRSLVNHARARSGFYVPAEMTGLRAVAPGRFAAEVPSVPVTGKATVTLSPAGQLTLSLLDDGRPLTECVLEVRGAEWPATWMVPELAVAHESLGGSPLTSDSWARPKPRSFQVQAREGAPFRLLALVPSTPIELIVRDRLGVEVLHETVELAPGEARDLQRTVSSRAVDLAGFVHSADGKPLSARIEWYSLDTDEGTLAWAKSDGRFHLEGIRAPRIGLVVQAEGYSWRWLHDVAPAKVEGALDIELKPGRSMSIGFMGGGDGRIFPSCVWIEPAAARPEPDGADLPPADGERVDGKRGRFGYGFENVPEGIQWLRVRIDDFTFAYKVEKTSFSATYNAMLRGPATIEWSIARPQAGRTLKAIRLIPSGGFYCSRATASIGAAAAERGSGSVRFEKLPIARYSVVLVWSDDIEETTDVTVDTSANPTPQVHVAR